jgi:hypothetical protein
MFIASMSIGTLPALCEASTGACCAAAAPISTTGWMVPMTFDAS